jgi:DNA-binding transcriptional regulator YdaS (Cro superfamily)
LPDVYVRTLQRAVQIEGGEEALALRLKVTPSHLALWINGIERPPVEVFLRAVDLVTDPQFARPDAKAARSGPEL